MQSLSRCLWLSFWIWLASFSAAQALVHVEHYTQNLSGATRIVLSADGEYAYATAFNSQALNVFKRNPSNGKLTLLQTFKQGLNNVTGLQGAWNLVISSDGKHVYVTAYSEDAIGIFARNPADGRLSFVQALKNNANNGLTRPNNLAFDAQSRYLYVTSKDGVAAFARNGKTGALVFASLYRHDTPGIIGLAGATGVSVSHDGNSVYVTGRLANSVVFFERDYATGGLSFFSHIPNGFNNVTGLGGAYDIQIAPDDKLVFVSGNRDAAIAAFIRLSDGRLSYQHTYHNGSNGIDGLQGVQQLQFSQDGSRLFAVGNSENALVMFNVLGSASTQGFLRFSEVIKENINGISTLAGISSVAVDNNLQHVYTTALFDNNISLLSLDSADLRLSMNYPTEAQMGGVFNYTLQVSNAGPGAATAVTLTDTLPAQVSYNSGSSDSRCNLSANTVVCALGTLSAGQSETVTLSVTANALGTLVNTASVSSPKPDGDLSNNNAQANTQILNQTLSTDLAVTLAVDANPVNLSSPFTYSIEANNLGPADATHVEIVLTYPSSTGFDSAQSSAGTCNTVNNNQLRCRLDLLKVNTPQRISVNLFSPSQATEMLASVSISSAELEAQSSNNTAEVRSRVELISTDLALLSTILQPSSGRVGQVLTYEAGVRNLAADAAQGVVLEANFSPVGATRFVSAFTTNPNAIDAFNLCSDQGQGVVRCALGTVNAVANPLSVQLSVLPIVPGLLNADFSLSSSATDTDLGNNQVAATGIDISGEAIDLALSVSSVTPDPAFIGNPLQYVFSVTNSHANAQASNVSLAISLPNTVNYIGASAAQGAGCSENAGIVNCNIGTIAAQGTVDLALTVRPISGSEVLLSAQVSSDSFDPDNSNNSASRSVSTQTATADLQLTGTATPNPVALDDELALDFKVLNKGPSQANNVQLELQLPTAASYEVLSASVVNASDCVVETAALRCNLGLVVVDAEYQIAVRLQPRQAGLFSVAATLQGNVQDTDLTNNSLNLESFVNQPLALTQSQIYVDGSDGIRGVQSLLDVILSSDGRFLYASNFNQDGVVVFQRQTSTGELSFLQFISTDDAAVDNTSLGGASKLALNDDETWLYVGGFTDDRLVALLRNSDSGRLSFAQAVDGEDVGLQALQGPFAVAARGDFIYVADFNTDSLLVLQQTGTAGASNLVGVQTVTGLDGLNGINYLEISPDGTQLYATSSLDNSLMVFNRNSSTGQLTQTQVLRNPGIGGASAVLASADNQHLYVAGGAEHSLLVFQREANNSLQYLQTLEDGNLLNNVSDLAISADGKYVYAAATNNNALTVLERNASTGLLTVQSSFVEAVDGVQGLSGIRAVAASPEAQQVYTVALNANAVSLFRQPSADLAVEFTASNTQIASGQELVYSLLTKNLGPNRATSVQLELQLPEQLALLNIDNGLSCQQNLQTISCRLGSLEADSSTELKFTVIAEAAGLYTPTAQVTALQEDPDSSNNSASLELDVTGVANLVVSMIAEPPFSAIGNEINYKITLINAGPDIATEIVLSNELPAQLDFISSRLNGQTCEFDAGVITCRLNSLAAQASVSGDIIATVQTDSTISNSVSVVGKELDLSEPNQAVAIIRPNQHVISTDIDNSGQTLSNVLITSTGVVNGGTVSGSVLNQGRLNNVTIASNTEVAGNGVLAGSIINNGTIQNAQLVANSSISGGRITGLLLGGSSLSDNLLPRLNTVRLEAGAEVRNVLIGSAVSIDELAVLGSGVKFNDADLIPIGRDISNLFTLLQENYTQSKGLNIDASPTLNAQDNVLAGLNSSPELAGAVISQTAWGHAFFASGPFIINATPVRVIRREPLLPSSLLLPSDGTAVFVSDNQFEVLFQPALRQPQALDVILQALGLNAVSLSNGNIESVLPANAGRLLVRPDWFIYPADSSLDPGGNPAALGFQALADQPSVGYALLFFNNDLGERRQQFLYPAAADREAWLNNSEISQLELNSAGSLSFSQAGKSYQGVFDYSILAGGVPGGNAVNIAESDDKNGDNITDLLVTYPNGEEQIVFLRN